MGFEAAYRDHSLALIRMAWLLTGSREKAEDAVHEVFLRYLRVDPPPNSPWSYLRRMLINQLIDEGRRATTAARFRVDRVLLFDDPELDETWEAVCRLPEGPRRALVLRYYADLPIADIAEICRRRGVLLHCDATQAVGKMAVDVRKLGADLLSFSAHKLYGPKGVGALYVRRSSPPVRLQPQIDGGGQEHGLRSGTLNVPGIVGLARAIQLCLDELPAEADRLAALRDRLLERLTGELEGVSLNGPACADRRLRLPGNLNLSFAWVDGEALMMAMKTLAVSSGSACTSANPEPSHVLRALGLDEDATRASLRFGLGRFNTADDVEFAVAAVSEAVGRLRKLSSRP